MTPRVRKAWIGWWVDGNWCPTSNIRDHAFNKRLDKQQPSYAELQEISNKLTSALEGIAHHAPGRAGVVARDELVEMGVWSATIDRDERPFPLESWLLLGAPMPPHDFPGNRDAIRDALIAGTVAFVIDRPATNGELDARHH